MKKTLKHLLGDLSDYLGDEDDYYDVLGSLQMANLSIDKLKQKLQRLVAEYKSADKKYEAGKMLVDYWVEAESCRPDDDLLICEFNEAIDKVKEELGLEYVDVDETQWNGLDTYFNNLAANDSNLDILHDRLETAVESQYDRKRLLESFEKIEDLAIREKKMEGCVKILEDAKHKRDSVVKEADYSFDSVVSDVEEKLNEYIEQN